MKKTYIHPNTAITAIYSKVSFLAGSTGLEVGASGKVDKQDIDGSGVLNANDEGGDNLGKGRNLWDDWDD